MVRAGVGLFSCSLKPRVRLNETKREVLVEVPMPEETNEQISECAQTLTEMEGLAGDVPLLTPPTQSPQRTSRAALTRHRFEPLATNELTVYTAHRSVPPRLKKDLYVDRRNTQTSGRPTSILCTRYSMNKQSVANTRTNVIGRPLGLAKLHSKGHRA